MTTSSIAASPLLPNNNLSIDCACANEKLILIYVPYTYTHTQKKKHSRPERKKRTNTPKQNKTNRKDTTAPYYTVTAAGWLQIMLDIKRDDRRRGDGLHGNARNTPRHLPEIEEFGLDMYLLSCHSRDDAEARKTTVPRPG